MTTAAPLRDWRARPVLTVAEAAAVLGVSRSTGYEAVRLGQVPTLLVGGRLRVPTAALLRLLGETPDVAEGSA